MLVVFIEVYSHKTESEKKCSVKGAIEISSLSAIVAITDPFDSCKAA